MDNSRQCGRLCDVVVSLGRVAPTRLVNTGVAIICIWRDVIRITSFRRAAQSETTSSHLSVLSHGRQQHHFHFFLASKDAQKSDFSYEVPSAACLKMKLSASLFKVGQGSEGKRKVKKGSA